MTNCTDTIVVSRSVPAKGRADQGTGFLRRCAATVVTALVLPVKLAMKWQRHEMQRHHISAMNDHMLRDMGITRNQLENEMAKPFWSLKR